MYAGTHQPNEHEIGAEHIHSRGQGLEGATLHTRRLDNVPDQVKDADGVQTMTRAEQNEELRYILDRPPQKRTGEMLAFLKVAHLYFSLVMPVVTHAYYLSSQDVLEQRRVWKSLDVSTITLLEMLRTMTIGTEDPRS